MGVNVTPVHFGTVCSPTTLLEHTVLRPSPIHDEWSTKRPLLRLGAVARQGIQRGRNLGKVISVVTSS